MAQPLASLKVEGFTSIRATTVELTSDITLLVGANGAGKSNVVAAFELLGRIVDGQLNEYVLRRGGLQSLLYAAADDSHSADSVRLEAWGTEDDGGWRNGYKSQIFSGSGDAAMLSETTFAHDTRRYPAPFDVALGASRETRLPGRAELDYRYRFVLETMAGCRVFHFDDTSSDAPPKTRTDVADDLSLGPHAHNLGPLLLRLREGDRPRYDRIVRSIRSVAPFFDDFVLQGEHGTMLLRWRERGLDRTFSADALSDGTLRFICLAVLLLQPESPATIVLDEPELGLHPFAIHQLAGLMRIAARHSRIVAATQSVTLLSQFSVDQIAVVERTSEGTVVSRPDVDVLEPWLDDYSLGEVWEKNLIGGRPRPDELPPAQAQ